MRAKIAYALKQWDTKIAAHAGAERPQGRARYDFSGRGSAAPDEGEAATSEAPGSGSEESDENDPSSNIITIDFTKLPDTEPPKQEFLVEDWLPVACMSSLYGQGGVGKSMVAQQLATCIAAGLPFFGFKVTQGPVLGLFAEDPDVELERRQWRINRILGLRNAQLGALHIQGRVGIDNCIAAFPNGTPQIMPFHASVAAKAEEIGAKLIILDNRAQMLLVNENDRAQATFAANLVAGFAGLDSAPATLLLGHVAKAEESEYSGSTAWDAVTRSRWWLHKVKSKDDDEDETVEAKDQPLAFERVKSNYAPPDEIRLEWADGVLMRSNATSEQTSINAEVENRKHMQAFKDALTELIRQGRNVSHSPQAQSYAPRVMVNENMVNGATKRQMTRAMQTLLKEGVIAANQEVGQRDSRHRTYGINFKRCVCAPV